MLVNNSNYQPIIKQNLQGKRIPEIHFAANPSKTYQNKNINTVNTAQVISFIGKKLRESLDSITLMYTTDTHRNLDNMPKLKTAVDSFRNASENSVLLNAGDYSMGSKGVQFHANMLDRVGVDIATLGNHEFFSGYDELATAIKNSEFQTVVSNLQVTENNPLKELFKSGKLAGSVVKDINGHKYGFIGATTPDLYNYPKYLGDTKILDPVESVRYQVRSLEKKGINRIIVISHLGLDFDRKIAQNIKGVDVIVGGHDHKALLGINKGNNLFEHTGKNGRKEPVLLLHGGAHNNMLGVSHLVFNQDGILRVNSKSDIHKPKAQTLFNDFIAKIKTAITGDFSPRITTNQLVEVNKFEEDKDIAKLVEERRAQFTQLATLDKAVSKSWPVWKADRIGTLVADAVKDYTCADASMVQNGCIKRGFEKGPVYEEYIDDFVIPFNSPLVTVKAKGSDIINGLNIGADSIGIADHDIGVVQVSGLKYTIDMKRPEGSRVVPESVMINQNGKLVPLELDKEYNLAIDEYIHKGGSGFDSFVHCERLEIFEGKGFPKVLASYIKKNSENLKSIHPETKERIQVKHPKAIKLPNPKKAMQNYRDSKKEIIFNN